MSPWSQHLVEHYVPSPVLYARSTHTCKSEILPLSSLQSRGKAHKQNIKMQVISDIIKL